MFLCSSYNVTLQYGLLQEDPFKVKSTKVDGLIASVQNKLSHGESDRRRLLQTVTAEARGKVHVGHKRVQSDNAVLIKGVVVVKPSPRA